MRANGPSAEPARLSRKQRACAPIHRLSSCDCAISRAGPTRRPCSAGNEVHVCRRENRRLDRRDPRSVPFVIRSSRCQDAGPHESRDRPDLNRAGFSRSPLHLERMQVAVQQEIGRAACDRESGGSMMPTSAIRVGDHLISPAICPNHAPRPLSPLRAIFLSPHFLRRPNHGHFGTDVGI